MSVCYFENLRKINLLVQFVIHLHLGCLSNLTKLFLCSRNSDRFVFMVVVLCIYLFYCANLRKNEALDCRNINRV
jgi:hypothetical protein